MADRDLRELERQFAQTGTLQDYAPLLRERYRRGLDLELTSKSSKLIWDQFAAVRFYDPDLLAILISAWSGNGIDSTRDYWYPNTGGRTKLRINQVYDGHKLRRLYVSSVDAWGDVMSLPSPDVA